MDKKKKRVRSHPKLTAEKQAELRRAAEEEQALRGDPRVRNRDLRMKNQALAKEILARIQSEMPSALPQQKDGRSGT